MATDAEKKEFDRQSIAPSKVPVREFPKIPDIFKQRPEHRAAWDKWEGEVRDYFRSPAGPTTTTPPPAT